MHPKFVYTMLSTSVTVRILLAAGLAASAAVPASAQADRRGGARPRLVVFITVDQLRSDYFERFGSQLTGGLKQLQDGGAFFADGFHDHAITETAPGHAATLSGRFPVHTGIVMNAQGVNGVPDAQVIGARPSESASPMRFQGTVLLDWMRAANANTRWLSVSRKDRGAILPMGKNKGHVYWYAETGGFTTSQYYMDSLPAWVQAFNAQRIPQSYAGKAWSLLRPPAAYPEPDSVGVEASGFDNVFPHPFPMDPAWAAAILPNFPMSDELTLRFALDGVQALELGADASRTDLLAVSLSSMDAIGHRFGPDSRELHDQVLRLDTYLAAFLDSLEVLRGKGQILVALTADHGVAPLPMLKSTRYPNGDAKRVSLDPSWNAFLWRLNNQGIDTTAVAMEEGLVAVVKPDAFGSIAKADALLAHLAQDFMRVQGVLRADLMKDLAKADTVRDTIARRWLHMFVPNSIVRLVVTLTPYSFWSDVAIAPHGTPHDYDANVPVVFWGAGVVPGQYAESVRVVDMAPTLAAILGVRPTERLDGRTLTKVVR